LLDEPWPVLFGLGHVARPILIEALAKTGS